MLLRETRIQTCLDVYKVSWMSQPLKFPTWKSWSHSAWESEGRLWVSPDNWNVLQSVFTYFDKEDVTCHRFGKKKNNEEPFVIRRTSSVPTLCVLSPTRASEQSMDYMSYLTMLMKEEKNSRILPVIKIHSKILGPAPPIHLVLGPAGFCVIIKLNLLSGHFNVRSVTTGECRRF